MLEEATAMPLNAMVFSSRALVGINNVNYGTPVHLFLLSYVSRLSPFPEVNVTQFKRRASITDGLFLHRIVIAASGRQEGFSRGSSSNEKKKYGANSADVVTCETVETTPGWC